MRQGKLEGIQVIRKRKFSHIFRIETRGDFFKQLCHGYPSSHWNITTNTQINIYKKRPVTCIRRLLFSGS